MRDVEWTDEYLKHEDSRPVSIAAREAKLRNDYLSAMRALQRMVVVFSVMPIRWDPEPSQALEAANAEIERYLKEHAPKVSTSKLIWERRPYADNLETVLRGLVGQKVMITYKDGGVEVTGILEVMSAGSRYVRARFTNRERPMEVIPLYNIRRITAT